MEAAMAAEAIMAMKRGKLRFLKRVSSSTMNTAPSGAKNRAENVALMPMSAAYPYSSLSCLSTRQFLSLNARPKVSLTDAPA